MFLKKTGLGRSNHKTVVIFGLSPHIVGVEFFFRGGGIYLLTKGILLDMDTMDLLMLVMDEHKKFVIFYFLS